MNCTCDSCGKNLSKAKKEDGEQVFLMRFNELLAEEMVTGYGFSARVETSKSFHTCLECKALILKIINSKKVVLIGSMLEEKGSFEGKVEA